MGIGPFLSGLLGRRMFGSYTDAGGRSPLPLKTGVSPIRQVGEGLGPHDQVLEIKLQHSSH
jgi:hypothetical protein